MRAEGRPSGVAVARVMALGSCRSAASAPSNQRRNCTMGSEAASDSLRPARVYSLRSRATCSTEVPSLLPAPGAGSALEGSDYLRGDPTAVEISRLRLDPLAVHPASVHLRRVERHVVFEAPVGRNGVGIVPSGPRLATLVGDYVVVARTALPLAQRDPARGSQVLHPDVLRRDVVDRRVAGLEHPLGARRIGERHPAEDHLDASLRVLQPRRARIIPHGLPARTGLDALTGHPTPPPQEVSSR